MSQVIAIPLGKKKHYRGNKALGNSKGTVVWIQLNKYTVTFLITNHPKRSPLDKNNNRVDRCHRI